MRDLILHAFLQVLAQASAGLQVAKQAVGDQLDGFGVFSPFQLALAGLHVIEHVFEPQQIRLALAHRLPPFESNTRVRWFKKAIGVPETGGVLLLLPKSIVHRRLRKPPAAGRPVALWTFAILTSAARAKLVTLTEMPTVPVAHLAAACRKDAACRSGKVARSLRRF
jgi:hypothetical protein